VRRSTPNPKANPIFSSLSKPTCRITLGCTIPHPSTSNHPVSLQTRHPFPLHITQAISISAEGSVKGKKDGRNLTDKLSFSKKFLMNSTNTPFKDEKLMFSSIHNPST